MKNDVKKIKAEVERLSGQRKVERDEDGNVIINMTVKNDDDFLSVFSEYNEPIISTEVSDFIEASTETVLPNESLALHIHSNCIDEEEKEEYKKSYQRILNKRNFYSILLLLAL